MKCQRCSRSIFTPAATVGRYAFGPKCAKAMGLVEPKKRGSSLFSCMRPRRSDADEAQMGLFTGLLA